MHRFNGWVLLIFALLINLLGFLAVLKVIFPNIGKLNIQDVASLVQMGFFITGSTVAVLTYLSAKKGLLNTVNTEYHKRTMDHLEKLSTRLLEEFDEESEEYWAKKSLNNIKVYIEFVETYKRKVIQKIEDDTNYPSLTNNYSINKLGKILYSVKSEPFLPEKITLLLISRLEEKHFKMEKIAIEETEKFAKDLMERKYDEHLENAAFILSNIINKRMYENGCGISQIEDDVHNIRIEIREYLKSFDPFNNKRV